MEWASQTFFLVKTFSHGSKMGSLIDSSFSFYDRPAPELAHDDFGGK